MNTKAYQIRNSLILFAAALVWGFAFIAQKSGSENVEPFTFNGVRFLIGAAVLIPVILLTCSAERKKEGRKELIANKKELLIGGTVCGTVLFAGSNLQQYGITLGTEVGKAGFITAVYVVLIPIFGKLLFRKNCPKIVWAGVAVSLVGLYMLCIVGTFSVALSDLLVFLCAIVYSFHILFVGVYTERVNGAALSALQFLVAGILSVISMFLFESPSLSSILSAWMPIGFAGVFSCGVGFTLQVVGQKGVNPSVASLILSLESAISLIAARIIFDEKMTMLQYIGCALVFGAVILVECVPERKAAKK